MPTCNVCGLDYSKKAFIGVVPHGIKYDCDLKALERHDMYRAAEAAYETRISAYVRTYYAKIIEAVERGRFSVAFDFVCDDEDDRPGLLTRVIDRLKIKFKDVVFSTDSIGHGFHVGWGCVYDHGFTPPKGEYKPVKSLNELYDFTTVKSLPELDNTPLDIGKFSVGLKATLQDEDK